MLLAAVAACDGKKDAAPRPPAEVGIVVLTAGPVTLSTELTGRTSAYQISEVRPQVAGLIKQRLFEEGAMVTQGQPLYQIDPALYRAARDDAAAQLASARASAKTAQAKAARYKRLTDTEAVSRQDADDVFAAAAQADASVKQAEATLQTAEINLGYTKVLAPISGRIGRSSVTSGALVTTNQTDALATIRQLDPMYVDITQSSTKLMELRQALASGGVTPASATVRVKFENGTEYKPEGTVEFAESMVDEATGSVTIRARFPNPEGVLLPGLFVRVTAPQAVLPQAILAPQQGITRDAKGGATALVVDGENKVVRKTVTADRAIGDTWLVTTGLQAGDKLVVEGTMKAQPGAVVRPVPVELKKAP